ITSIPFTIRKEIARQSFDSAAFIFCTRSNNSQEYSDSAGTTAEYHTAPEDRAIKFRRLQLPTSSIANPISAVEMIHEISVSPVFVHQFITGFTFVILFRTTHFDANHKRKTARSRNKNVLSHQRLDSLTNDTCISIHPADCVKTGETIVEEFVLYKIIGKAAETVATNTDAPYVGTAAITTDLAARLAMAMADYDIQVHKYDDRK
ncbi:uncharacterized protein Bfra_007957, partial [Botrytis fragariae]